MNCGKALWLRIFVVYMTIFESVIDGQVVLVDG